MMVLALVWHWVNTTEQASARDVAEQPAQALPHPEQRTQTLTDGYLRVLGEGHAAKYRSPMG